MFRRLVVKEAPCVPRVRPAPCIAHSPTQVGALVAVTAWRAARQTQAKRTAEVRI